MYARGHSCFAPSPRGFRLNTNVQINDLARAMVRHALQDAGPGIDVLEGHSLFALTK